MNLFGCKFCDKVGDETECDRKNFDSLLWALVTVFQVDYFNLFFLNLFPYLTFVFCLFLSILLSFILCYTILIASGILINKQNIKILQYNFF